MPLKVYAGKDKGQMEGFYQFSYREGWKTFWNLMTGSKEKITTWASKTDIREPELWYNGLRTFLFHSFPDVVFKLSAAKMDSFSEYLKKVQAYHDEDPHKKQWYINKGMTYRTFMRVLSTAVEIDDEEQAVFFLNAKYPDFGFTLHEQYWLSLAGLRDAIQKEASRLAEGAHILEREVGLRFKKGQKVKHLLSPKELTFLGTVEDESGYLCQDANEVISLVEDVWNLALV